jgi:hypothetical protein
MNRYPKKIVEIHKCVNRLKGFLVLTFELPASTNSPVKLRSPVGGTGFTGLIGNSLNSAMNDRGKSLVR